MCKKNENVKIDKSPKEKRIILDSANKVVQMFATVCTVIVSFIGLCIGEQAINYINQISQRQQQIQQQIQNQTQQQLQTQVVIEPRDGDIIVHVGDDYKLLQLINFDDIMFPSKIQEIQIKKEESNMNNRVDILNDKQEDWSSRDSFKYMISNFSINPNKVINLIGTIESLTVFCDFYEDKNISKLILLNDENAYFFKIIDGFNDTDISISNINEISKKEYVTKEVNDGIEWVKIRVEIVYALEIDGKIIRVIDTIISDWIETDADIF